MTDAPAFLNVDKSLKDKRWRLRSENERLGLAIAQRLDVPEIVGRVMAGRDVPLEEAVSDRKRMKAHGLLWQSVLEHRRSCCWTKSQHIWTLTDVLRFMTRSVPWARRRG